MGDEAEAVFAAVAPLGSGYDRLGWDRPSVSMKNMSVELRHLPDFYSSSGYCVECGGLGRDGVYKLKVSKYEALKFWNRMQAVVLFVWNSHTKQWALVPWAALKRLVAKARKLGIRAFPNDGNEYYPLLWEWFEAAGALIGEFDPDGQ